MIKATAAALLIHTVMSVCPQAESLPAVMPDGKTFMCGVRYNAAGDTDESKVIERNESPLYVK